MEIHVFRGDEPVDDDRSYHSSVSSWVGGKEMNLTDAEGTELMGSVPVFQSLEELETWAKQHDMKEV